jgi:hypothetical protein
MNAGMHESLETNAGNSDRYCSLQPLNPVDPLGLDNSIKLPFGTASELVIPRFIERLRDGSCAACHWLSTVAFESGSKLRRF